MPDRGFFLTWLAIRRHLAAMPYELYLVRLIHHATRSAFPGERLWTAAQLSRETTIRFLRLRNREGCDVYIHPYAEDRNAGYILVDLDAPDPTVVERMRGHGLDPCLVIQTSPGHLQAWLHICRDPLEPALATAVAQHLARTYGGDGASANWRHLGRLAGFTNQKPARRTSSDYAPWVTIVHARAGLAPGAEGLLRSVTASVAPVQGALPAIRTQPADDPADPPGISPAEAIEIYRQYMQRWRIAERFPQPDWSIVDLWIARQLLSLGTPAARVRTILQLGSPQFPRRHGDPQDYLRRTLLRAAFSRPAHPALCAPLTNPSPAHTP